jgi:hypothetical protein
LKRALCFLPRGSNSLSGEHFGARDGPPSPPTGNWLTCGTRHFGSVRSPSGRFCPLPKFGGTDWVRGRESSVETRLNRGLSFRGAKDAQAQGKCVGR